MLADPMPDVARIRTQLTRPEREETARTVRESLEELDVEIEREQTPDARAV
jgi:hypothetical protein